MTSGQELLREPSRLQLEQLGLSDRHSAVMVTSHRCAGFRNPGDDICFLTAPLQIFLRLELVAGALR